MSENNWFDGSPFDWSLLIKDFCFLNNSEKWCLNGEFVASNSFLVFLSIVVLKSFRSLLRKLTHDLTSSVTCCELVTQIISKTVLFSSSIVFVFIINGNIHIPMALDPVLKDFLTRSLLLCIKWKLQECTIVRVRSAFSAFPRTTRQALWRNCWKVSPLNTCKADKNHFWSVCAVILYWTHIASFRCFWTSPANTEWLVEFDLTVRNLCQYRTAQYPWKREDAMAFFRESNLY